MDPPYLQDLMNEIGITELGIFQPSPRYHHGMDMVEYHAENSTTVTDWVDPRLSLISHGHEDRVVGVKFDGFKYEFQRLRNKIGWREGQLLPLTDYLDVIRQEEVSEEIASIPGRDQKYDLARKCIRQVHLTAEDMQEILG